MFAHLGKGNKPDTLKFKQLSQQQTVAAAAAAAAAAAPSWDPVPKV